MDVEWYRTTNLRYYSGDMVIPPPNLNLEHHIVMDGLMSCILLTSLKVSELLLLVRIVLSVLLQGGGHGHMSQDEGFN